MSNYIFDPTAAAAFIDSTMNKVNLYESPHMFCDIYCLKPGQSQKAHQHDRNDKVYYALSGECHVRIGDEIRPLAPGHVAIAPAGMVHGVENRSETDVTLLVIMAPHPRLSEEA